jgi:hypothetical protein
MYSFQYLHEQFKKQDIKVIKKYLNSYYNFLKGIKKYDTGIYSELHHILPRSIFHSSLKDPENIIELSARDHLKAHYYLALACPECRSIQIAFFLMSTHHRYAYTISKYDLPFYEKAYEISRLQLRQTISDVNKGMVGVKNSQGVYYRVSINDPKYLSGEFKHQNTGNIVVKNKSGKILCVKNDDPRWLSGELKGIATGTSYTKGFVWMLNSKKERVFVNKNNDRILTGELVKGVPEGYAHYTKGKIVTYNKLGKRILTLKDDPRILSGELTLIFNGEHSSKNTVAAHNAGNKLFFVSKNDTRLQTGELIQGKPKTYNSPTKGKIATFDASNKLFYVDKKDSRITTGELTMGIPQHIKSGKKGFIPPNKNKIRFFDSGGHHVYTVSTDPRVLSGELTNIRPVKNKETQLRNSL